MSLRDADDLGLPCSLCGGPLKIVHIGNDHTPNQGFDSGCPECRIKRSDRILRRSAILSLDGLRAKVVEGWKRRPAQSAEALLAECREVLEPFAKVAPSSFYAPDGSEGECYWITLHDGLPQTHDLTGADLARARSLLSKLKERDGG